MTSGGESEWVFRAILHPLADTAAVSDRLRQLESPVTHRDGHPESRSRSAAFDLPSKDHMVPDVSQLRRVLTETVTRQRSGIINADKLPPECRSVTRRTLTQMEALQRDAIDRSPQDKGGDKQDAAHALELSRATIYRKVNDYGFA
jgi:DNA-binding NtrC family response regulator